MQYLNLDVSRSIIASFFLSELMSDDLSAGLAVLLMILVSVLTFWSFCSAGVELAKLAKLVLASPDTLWPAPTPSRGALNALLSTPPTLWGVCPVTKEPALRKVFWPATLARLPLNALPVTGSLADWPKIGAPSEPPAAAAAFAMALPPPLLIWFITGANIWKEELIILSTNNEMINKKRSMLLTKLYKP